MELISREAAIDEMYELQGRASTKAELTGISKAWKRLNKLPTASKHDEFVKGLDKMFDTIYDCEIDHPVFQDTVRDIINAVIELYDTLHPAERKDNG